MENEILRFRHNAMEVCSICGFENIRGGINQNCKDVYFVRALGTNTSLVNDITGMDRALVQRMREGRCTYIRIKELPKMTSVEEADYYSGCYANWQNHGKTEMAVKATAQETDMRRLLGKACAQILPYLKDKSVQVSGSIEKNFIVKVIFWFDWLAKDLFGQWKKDSSVKVVADNVVKKQEYLFYYMLTLLGADVMLIQNEQDIDTNLDAFNLSKKFVLGDFAKVNIPDFDIAKSDAAVKQPHAAAVESARTVSVSVQGSRTAEVSMSGQNTEGSLQRSGSSDMPIRIHIPERTRPSRNKTAAQEHRAEKTFEELARLASSVVMIAIHDNRGEIVGTGSGIMVGREGFILTNNHVASGGRSYSVRIEDDEQLYRTDEMIKYNPVLDLAVIRIQRRLNPLPIYQGNKPLVRGQKVVAIGSPLGMFNSVSDGIISGFRKIDTVDMIQFTAPTSRGSSGGAVLNMYGEVIGISTAGIDNGQNINLAMGYECINAFVRGFI